MAQLQVNDTCPDVSFSSVMNENKFRLRLSDFKDKALIIDFWDTRCHSCIENFAAIDSLQKKFRNDLQIILVTKQDRKTVEEFFSRFRKIKASAVPLITDDTELSSLFPSDGYPYMVWMDRNRVVSYFTGGYNITQEHLEKFLKGINLSVKNVARKTAYSPIWKLEDSVFTKHVKYFSSLTSCINGIDIGLPTNELLNGGSLLQLSSNCSTLLALIKKAFGENGKYAVNTRYGIEFHMDSSLLIRPEDPNLWDEWDKNNRFNYQLLLPVSKKEQLYQAMQQDLERYFDISAVHVKGKIKGYVLTPVNGELIPGSKTKLSFDAYNDTSYEADDTLRFINQPAERLNYLLNSWMHYYFPFKSLVKDQKRIDFKIAMKSIEPINIEALNRDLKPLHLQLKEAEIETDVIIISQKK